jgi:hypothetical protein
VSFWFDIQNDSQGAKQFPVGWNWRKYNSSDRRGHNKKVLWTVFCLITISPVPYSCLFWKFWGHHELVLFSGGCNSLFWVKFTYDRCEYMYNIKCVSGGSNKLMTVLNIGNYPYHRIENGNGDCIKETKKNTKERNSKSRPVQFSNQQTPL